MGGFLSQVGLSTTGQLMIQDKLNLRIFLPLFPSQTTETVLWNLWVVDCTSVYLEDGDASQFKEQMKYSGTNQVWT